MFEKRWAAVSPQLFTANGTQGGAITVVDSSIFKVKQQVNITANTLPPLNLEIKQIPNDVTVIVGPVGGNINTFTDVSAYTTALSAAISANEQKRASIPQEEVFRAVYDEEPTVALRVVPVDKHGNRIDENNPLPTTATISGDVTIGTDGYDQTNPDSMNVTGSENGQENGIKHSLRVDSDLDLRVGISNGANKAEVDGTGRLSVKDITAHTILSAISNQLANDTIKVDDDAAQVLLNTILSQLESGGIIIGTEDGTPTGTQHVFVNNLRQMVMASYDRVGAITWLDIADKKNRRVDKLEYTSATFPGITVRKQFSYTLVGNEYVRTSPGTWSIV